MVRLASGRKLSTSSQPYIAGPSPSWSSARLSSWSARPPRRYLYLALSSPRSCERERATCRDIRDTTERYASFGYPTGRLARLRSACLYGCILDRIGPGDRYAKGSSSQDFQHSCASMPPGFGLHESAFRYVRRAPMHSCASLPESVTSLGNRNSGRVIRNTVSNLAYLRSRDNYLECFYRISLKNLRNELAVKINSRSTKWICHII